MQELEVKLLQIQPDAEAIVEIEQERDLWKEKCEGVVVENSQLRVLYEELLKYISQEVSSADSVREQQIIEQLKQEEANIKQWKSKCEEFNQEITKWKSQCGMLESEKGKLKEQCAQLAGKLERVGSTIELECYRAEAKVRRQWEACEDRLVQQLQELQH